MLRDEDYIAVIMANDAALLRRVIDLVDKAPLSTSDGSMALVQVLRRLADHHAGNLGLYAAVLREGVVSDGDEVRLLD